MPSYTYYNASVIAGWSRFSGSVIICLLPGQPDRCSSLFVNAPKLPLNGNLLFLSIAQNESRAQIDSVPFQTKSSSKLNLQKMAPATKLALATKLMNIPLTASLVLLADAVSPKPAPDPSQLAFEGEKSYINIRSLKNKLTELRLFW